MSDTPTRYSPVHHLLELRQPVWQSVGGAALAVRFCDEQAERAAMQSLGLCDLSALTKLGLKGRLSADWLAGHNVDVPAAIYESRPLADGGVIVRLGTGEFLLESGIAGDVVSARSKQLLKSSPQQVYHVERQDATFLLTGSKAVGVFAQTCGVNFREMPAGRIVFTRVAGVNCGILPQLVGQVPAWRFWIDPSYAADLWKTLEVISSELGGSVIGAACIYPELNNP
jgi:sarcosine oxidase subunit gamma